MTNLFALAGNLQSGELTEYVLIGQAQGLPDGASFAARLRSWLTYERKKLIGQTLVATSPLVATLVYIAVVLDESWSRNPTNGDVFARGQLKANNIIITLFNAKPNEELWSSEASERYEKAVLYQISTSEILKYAESMMEQTLDQMADKLDEEERILEYLGYAMIGGIVFVSAAIAAGAPFLALLACAVGISTTAQLIAVKQAERIDKFWRHGDFDKPSPRSMLELASYLYRYAIIIGSDATQPVAMAVNMPWEQHARLDMFDEHGLGDSWAGISETSLVSRTPIMSNPSQRRTPPPQARALLEDDLIYDWNGQITNRAQPPGPMAARRAASAQEDSFREPPTANGADNADMTPDVGNIWATPDTATMTSHGYGMHGRNL